MEQSMSRILVEVSVKAALKHIHDSPERSIRNLVDMALQCSEGRFQHRFFSVAQTMLQKEDSAYYELIRDTVANTDLSRLYTFGINLGYNACTVGARRIRENEKKLGCNIPWSILFQLTPQGFEKAIGAYDRTILEGEQLGIYMWMLFSDGQPQALLPLLRSHPDSAFCLFCKADDLTESFLTAASPLFNGMLVVRWDPHAAEVCAALRQAGFLYALWYPFGPQDAGSILDGTLFQSAQQLRPAFTVLLPDADCPYELHRKVHRAVQDARSAQTYRTILWEIPGDHRVIDSIISDDTCSVYFDRYGYLHSWDCGLKGDPQNLFQSALPDILSIACPKEPSRVQRP